MKGNIKKILLCKGIYLAASLIAVYTPLAVIFASVVMVITFVTVWKCNPAAAIVLPLFTAIVAGIVYGSYFASAFYILTFLPLALGIIIMNYRRSNLKNTIIISGIVQAIAIFALTGVFVYVRMGSFSQQNLEAALAPYFTRALFMDFAESQEFAQIISKINADTLANLKAAKNALIISLPQTVASFSVISAAISVIFTKRIMYKSGEDVSYMGRFTDFSISLSGIIVMAISFVLFLILGQSSYAMAFYNLYGFLLTLTAIAGVAFVLRFMRSQEIIPRSTKIFITIVVIATVFMGFSTILSFIGVVGTLLKFRKKDDNV